MACQFGFNIRTVHRVSAILANQGPCRYRHMYASFTALLKISLKFIKLVIVILWITIEIMCVSQTIERMVPVSYRVKFSKGIDKDANYDSHQPYEYTCKPEISFPCLLGKTCYNQKSKYIYIVLYILFI